MPIDQTLARARAELAAGQTDRSRQRLHGLLATYPHRTDVRAALAAAHRVAGNPVQAGRWAFLCPDRDTAETAAFLAAYPTTSVRVQAMRWVGPEHDAEPSVRDRMAELRAVAEVEVDRTTRPRPRPRPTPANDVLAMTGCLLVVAAVAALAVIGLVAVVRWIG